MASGILGTEHALHWALVVAGTGVLLVLLRPALHTVPSAAAVSDLRRLAARGLLVEDATARARQALAAPAPAPLLTAAAVAGTASAWVHALVIGSHAEGSTLAGAVFALLAAAQLAWAVALVTRPSRRVLLAGVAGNLLVAGLWLASRTAGGESVGLWDALATSYELVAVGAALAALRTLPRRPAVSPRQRAGVGVAVGITVVLAVAGF